MLEFLPGKLDVPLASLTVESWADLFLVPCLPSLPVFLALTPGAQVRW